MIIDVPVIVSGNIQNRGKSKIVYYLDYVPIEIKQKDYEIHKNLTISCKRIMSRVPMEKKEYIDDYYQLSNGMSLENKFNLTKQLIVKKDDYENSYYFLSSLSHVIDADFLNQQYGDLYKSKIKFLTEMPKRVISDNKSFLQNKIQKYFDENYFITCNDEIFKLNNPYCFWIRDKYELLKTLNKDMFITKQPVPGAICIPLSLPMTAKKISDEKDIRNVNYVTTREFPILDIQLSYDKCNPVIENEIFDCISKSLFNISKTIDIRELSLEAVETYVKIQKMIKGDEKTLEQSENIIKHFEFFCDQINEKDLKLKINENLSLIKLFLKYAIEEKDILYNLVINQKDEKIDIQKIDIKENNESGFFATM